jgi:hypothetical protein
MTCQPPENTGAQCGLSQVATLITLICNPASLIFAEQLGR